MTPDTDVDPDEEARLAGVAYMEDDLRASRRHAEAAFRAYSRSRRPALGRSRSR